MALNERRPHWRAGHTDGKLLARLQETDPDARQYACFTETTDASGWMIEQLAERTVAELGGFDAAAEHYAWLRSQHDRDEDYGDLDSWAPTLYADGLYTVAAVTFAEVEYRLQMCNCAGEVHGRCNNGECDRDTSDGSEPGGDQYPSYCRWYSNCSRCFGIEWASGGFAGGKPVPQHKHIHHTAARVRKLIEGDEHTGWQCEEYPANDRDQCTETWRFADAEQWASRYRLLRWWGSRATGTQGYTITEADAIAETERLNAASLGFTVTWEKIHEPEGA